MPPRAACGVASLPCCSAQGAAVCTPMLLSSWSPSFPQTQGRVLICPPEMGCLRTRGSFHPAGGTGVLEQEGCYWLQVSQHCSSTMLGALVYHSTDAFFVRQKLCSPYKPRGRCKNKKIVWDIFVCLETSTMTTCNTSKCREKYEVSLNIMCHWHSQVHLSERTEQKLNKREKLPASIFIGRCHLHSPLDGDSLLISSSSHQEGFWRVFLIDG